MDSVGRRKDEKNVRCRVCLENVGFSANTTNLKQHVEKRPEKVPADGV